MLLRCSGCSTGQSSLGFGFPGGDRRINGLSLASISDLASMAILESSTWATGGLGRGLSFGEAFRTGSCVAGGERDGISFDCAAS